MKVAFYVPNGGICNVDFSCIDDGNPGVGGSEYSAILIASNLCKKGHIDAMVLCDRPSNFPDTLKWNVCHSLVGAIKYTIKHQIDYLIVDGKFLTREIVCKFSEVKFIAWANTFISSVYYDFYARRDNIISIINVGKEELDLTRETPIYSKSYYIYNAVPTSVRNEYPNLLPNNKRGNNVCYIGSLHPAKGFQYLAKAWPNVLKVIPDAQLYVIGSGKLYGRKAKLGTWGIAKEEFENEFMPYLVSDDKIIDSVHFLGILGKEKYDILSKCKVGVPNPSGVSETFGYTAVEMEFMDCQVTTIRCAGYVDTVYDKTNLYNNTDELASYIIRLLQNNEYNNTPVLDYIKQFSIENIILEWEGFFNELENKSIRICTIKDSLYYRSIISYHIQQVKANIKKSIKMILRR